MLTLMAAAGLAACSGPTRARSTNGKGSAVEKVRYGKDSSQFAELSRPKGTSKGVVVVIHGGYWKSAYTLSLGRPLAASLVVRGWTAYNLEYRRVGNGGGWPQTFDDVATGIDQLASIDGIDTSKVITLGHSAGGHLGVWAAARPQLTGTSWTDPKVTVTAAVSQAGVLNLLTGRRDDLGGGAVQAFMGGAVDSRYPEADPTEQIPLDVPVRCIHGRNDDNVPITQSIDYVAAARKAGADATLTEADGDHFVLIDPATPAWAKTLKILDTL